MTTPVQPEADAKPSATRAAVLWAWLLPLHPYQIIAYSRLVLTGFALAAIYIDPDQPSRQAAATYALLALYTVYAAILVVAANPRTTQWRWGLAQHAVDLLACAALTYLTDGPTSPFFVFYTFALASGALRWGARGATATAAILLIVFLLISLPQFLVEHGAVDRVIVRTAYLVVASVLLGYFGAYRQRARERLAMLAAWPIDKEAVGAGRLLDTCLRHASSVLGAKRIVVVWEDARAPGWQSASLQDGAVRTGRIGMAEFNTLVAPMLDTTTFTTLDPRGSIVTTSKGALRLPAPALPAGLVKTFAMGQLATAHFSVPPFSGRVYILAPYPFTTELLPLTEIVARRVGLEFEYVLVGEQNAIAVAAQERVRLARDMHDSILQDFTAAGLQLAALARSAPPEALGPIGQVVELLKAEQRRVRAFVSMSNPKPGTTSRAVIADALASTAEELRQKWRCHLSIAVSPDDAAVSLTRLNDLRFILSEAVANSVRHGQASAVDVVVELDRALRLDIRDNGRTDETSLGGSVPFSVAQRVGDAGGKSELAIGRNGADLTIELPPERGAQG
jgi:signal transduction histidine kinase